MNPDPYRALALIEPLPVDPVVRTLRLAGALPFVKITSISYTPCPFCQTKKDVSYGPELDGQLCIGKRRWWRPWGCTLLVAHFHVRCVTCEARWIMAPANVQL